MFIHFSRYILFPHANTQMSCRNWIQSIIEVTTLYFYKPDQQPSKSVFIKSCSENMQQIYCRTSIPKCDFNNVAEQRYWNHASPWLFSCKFAAYFQNTFSKENLWSAASIRPYLGEKPTLLDILKSSIYLFKNIYR